MLSFRKRNKVHKLEEEKSKKMQSDEAIEMEARSSEDEKNKFAKDNDREESSEKEGEACDTFEQKSGTGGHTMHEKDGQISAGKDKFDHNNE